MVTVWQKILLLLSFGMALFGIVVLALRVHSERLSITLFLVLGALLYLHGRAWMRPSEKRVMLATAVSFATFAVCIIPFAHLLG